VGPSVGSSAPRARSACRRLVRSFGRSWWTRSEVVCGRVATLFLALTWAREGSGRGRVVRSGVVYPLRAASGAESGRSFRAMSWTHASLWWCRVGTWLAASRSRTGWDRGDPRHDPWVVAEPSTGHVVANPRVCGYSSNSPRDAGDWRRRTGARDRPSEALDDLDQYQRAAQCSSPPRSCEPYRPQPIDGAGGGPRPVAPGGARTHTLGVRKWPSARRHRGHEPPKASRRGGDRCPRRIGSFGAG
jgi:hypothetical protein